MNGQDPVQRRRIVFAQGAAALACFMVVHGAHAATLPVAKTGHVKQPSVTQKTYGTSR